jgi:hypothetical protein
MPIKIESMPVITMTKPREVMYAAMLAEEDASTPVTR